MKFHTNAKTVTHRNIREAISPLIMSGVVSDFINLDIELEPSRSHAYGCTIKLYAIGKREGDGRRRVNSGSYGAGSEWGATYDEWGHVINAIYDLGERDNANVVFGSVKSPIYASRQDFNERTGYTYDSAGFTRLFKAAGFDQYALKYGPEQAGRKGYGRVFGGTVEVTERLAKASKSLTIAPRTVAEIRAFNAGNAA